MNAVKEALAEAHQRYAKANPISKARYEAACAALPGGNTRSVLYYDPFPLGIARGEGCHIWDADEHRYLDLLGEYTAGLFGHSDPVIRAAVRRALDNGITLSGHGMLEGHFASAVSTRFPAMELLRFANSGTEANLLAVGTATMATGRREVLVFDGGYHGSMLAFAGGGAPMNVPHEFVVGTYNDVAGTRELLRSHRDTLAAVLVEPMLGSGGCIPGEPEFLSLLRAETEASGALLIFDEVMTSRLAPGGRQTVLGITPDLMTIGKYVGGGMSFGAFGGRREIMERFDPRRADAVAHAGTFNNNVLTMAAGLAAMTEVYTPEVAAALTARGDRLRSDLAEAIAGTPLQVTGAGSLMNFHFGDAPPRNAADVARGDAELKELFFFDLLDRGFHLARRGMIALSLPVLDSDCAEFVDAVAGFLADRKALLG